MRAATKVRMVENCILIEEESKIGRLQLDLRNGGYEVVDIAVVVEAMEEIERYLYSSLDTYGAFFSVVSCTSYSVLRKIEANQDTNSRIPIWIFIRYEVLNI